MLALMLSVVTAFSSITTQLFDHAEATSDYLRLVNRDNRLPYTFVPESLVLPDVQAAPRKEEAIYIDEGAAGALERLFAGASAAGHTLYAVSGYRSYSLQKSIYTRKVEAVGESQAMLTVAPPGASEHQLGLAMDINGETTLKRGLDAKFGESPEGLWVSENAHLYGFIVRYQKDRTDITGYAWEPWHLRYVGENAAREIYEMDVTLEEYLQIQRLQIIRIHSEP
ncbi:M15 family metallopeptidase [Eubacteriales bacterium OttesenSCG-928-A19]|nr:M15 family metallopeptidase [Eubacteriales bacterium OttesenSCG-928-A19]